jgi:hypothetical protein
VRINSRAAAVANGQPNAAFGRHIDPVKPCSLGGKSCLWRIDLEVLAVSVKLCQTNCYGSFDDAQRDSFVAQSDDAKDGICGQSNEIARISLYL